MSQATQAQADSVYLVRKSDNATGESYIVTNRKLVVASENMAIGFGIEAYINNDLTFSFVAVQMVGMGKCNEKDEMIVFFDNGEKITKTSWGTFNCEGDAYFDITDSDKNLLRTQTISQIKISNGKNSRNYTGNVGLKDKRFFIQVFYSLDRKLIGK